MGCRVLKFKKSNVLIVLLMLFVTWLHSCKTSEKIVVEKSGAELWGENCSRCHNMPNPSTYNDDQWETVTMHMQLRANISNAEIELIKEFLQSANGD